MKPIVALLAGVLGVCAVWPAGPARASTCEANFNSSGSKADGLLFGTWRNFEALDAADAIAQMRAIAQAEDFHVGPEQRKGDAIELTLLQKPTAQARGFPVLVSANPGNGTLTLIAHLMPQMDADPQAVRSYMCGLLAKVEVRRSAEQVAAEEDAARTAAPRKAPNLLRPKAVFDLGQAQAALEPGSSSITGTACVRRHVSNGGGLYLASNQSVLLYPATPYLQEMVQLMRKLKPGRDEIDFSPAFLATRMVGRTNAEGEFQFSKMKPGKYYLITTLATRAYGSRNVDLGSEVTDGGRTIVNYYTTENFSRDFNDVLERFVEIKQPGDTVKVTLTPPVRWTAIFGDNNGSAGIFGCR